MGQSISVGPASNSYEVLSDPTSPTQKEETKLDMQAEIEKVEVKYRVQIEQYEAKGVNPLTKKLIEKIENEMCKAVNKKREELMKQ